MTNLSERERRVTIICNTLFGSVISRDGDTMVIQVPADMIGAAGRMLGMGGFTWNFGKQSTRMTTKRITGNQGQTIVCDGFEELMALYQINVNLTPRDAKVMDPIAAVAGITRQVKP
jgi:hypothetical protein